MTTNYWKLKALYLAIENTRLQATTAIATLQAQFADEMRAADLDPAADYDLDDKTETLVPRTT